MSKARSEYKPDICDCCCYYDPYFNECELVQCDWRPMD